MGFENWNQKKITDLYTISSGLSKKREEFGFGYPFLTFKDVFHNYFLPNELVELANTSEKEQEKCSIFRGDVFLTRTSEKFEELGLSSVALKDYPTATFNGFTKRLRPNLVAMNELLPEFVAFYLRSNHFRNQILSLTNMSTRASLNNEMISKLEINYPTIQRQKSIVNLLYSIHQKVELNNSIISSLDQLVQTLFKRWFVDFEFPNENGEPYKSSGGEMVESELGLIPKGWEVEEIRNLPLVVSDHVANGSFAALKKNVTILEEPSYALFLRNVDLKANLSNQLRYVDKESYEFLKKSRLFGGEVIISNVADVGTVHRCPELEKPMVLGNNQIFMNSSDYPDELNTFFYLYFQSNKGKYQISSITSGSAQMKFNKTDFRGLKVVLPKLENLNQVNFKLLKGLLQKIDNLIEEKKLLSNLRDTLLPKLLSGEIELPDETEVTENVPVS